MSQASPQTTRAYPLSAVFFVITIVAILFSLVAPILVGDATIDLGSLVGWSISMGVSGLFLGGIIGLYHFRRRRGIAWGSLTGLFAGAFLGPVVVSNDFEQVSISCLIGSGILVVCTIVLRVASKRRRRP